MQSMENFPKLEEVVKNHVLLAIETAGGSKAKAAELLGVSVKTVYNHVNRHNAEGSSESLSTEGLVQETSSELSVEDTQSTESTELSSNELPTGNSNSIFG